MENSGTTQIIPDETFMNAVSEFQKDHDRAISRTDIKLMLTDKLTGDAEQNNLSVMTVIPQSEKIVNN